MIRLARRAALLVGLFMLISAATAYAECTWVLWSHIINKNGLERYDVESALPTLEECDAAVRDAAKTLKSRGYAVKSGSHGVLGQLEEKYWKYWCVPDTVDPRGPTGK